MATTSTSTSTSTSSVTYPCAFCSRDFRTKACYNRHVSVCRLKTIPTNLDEIIPLPAYADFYREQFCTLVNMVTTLDKTVQELKRSRSSFGSESNKRVKQLTPMEQLKQCIQQPMEWLEWFASWNVEMECIHPLIAQSTPDVSMMITHMVQILYNQGIEDIFFVLKNKVYVYESSVWVLLDVFALGRKLSSKWRNALTAYKSNPRFNKMLAIDPLMNQKYQKCLSIVFDLSDKTKESLLKRIRTKIVTLLKDKFPSAPEHSTTENQDPNPSSSSSSMEDK